MALRQFHRFEPFAGHCTATAPPLQELARQYGGDDEKGITLVPTVRIDGKEYRGKLDVSGARSC